MPRQRHFPALWTPVLLAACLCSLAATAADRSPGPSHDSGHNPRNIDAAAYGQRIALGPLWLFAAGDNPAYASPNYDDSGWTILDQSHLIGDVDLGTARYAWYRVHIHLRPGSTAMMVGLESIRGSYEVYVNGVRIGSAGDLYGTPSRFQRAMVVYPIPQPLLDSRGDMVLAVRCTFNRARTLMPFGPLTGVYLLSRESAPREQSYANAHDTLDDWVLLFLSLLTGIVALSLYLALRSQREYLAVAVYSLAAAGYNAVWLWEDLAIYNMLGSIANAVTFGTANVALIEFVRLVLGRARSRTLLIIEAASFLAAFGPLSTVSGVGNSIHLGFFAFYFATLTVDILLLVLLVRGWIEGNRAARILLPAIVVYSVAQWYSFLRSLVFYIHLVHALWPFFSLPVGTYSFTAADIGYFVFYVTLLLFLVLRTVSIARERAHAAAELEAARTTQQLLLARSSQSTPGFKVDTVYLPASEVGGDFFLVSPGADGSLMAIVGDVSGKGIIAAMRVAMIVGVLRREDTRSPAEALRNLNQALFMKGEAGFTTACCLRIDRGGLCTMANAGHLAPYIDGKEMAVPPSLPLGITEDAQFEEVTVKLAPGESLVLLSDGVVEARNATGELFGFERAASLSTQSADQIAHAAKQFGQEDDITVLTLQFAPAEVLHA
ncbi:MAG: SpoIIE family protein phosphatase [Terracidiphilus sp.]